MMILVVLATVFVVVIAAVAVVVGVPLRASAHCDTMDGPTAKDGRQALASGNLNHAKKWIGADHEAELEQAFARALTVRTLNDDARELADQYFIETLVRLHRAGEGAPYMGLLPSGVPIDDKVVAADKSLATGSLAPLAALVTPEELQELQPLFERAVALKDYDVDDVEAGRRYIEAYVHYFHFAEGEGHGHDHEHHEHEHEHGHHEHGAH